MEQLQSLLFFGPLLVIALYGLMRSNASSDRLNASTDGRDTRHTTYRPDENGGR